jgi:hypothetical protein
MRRSLFVLTGILVAVCVFPAVAGASATSDRIYSDCENSPTGNLTGSYGKGQLQSALDNLPSDISEYSGCYDAIRNALLSSGAHHGSGNGKSGGGSTGGGTSGGSASAGGTGSSGSSAQSRTAAGAPTATTAVAAPHVGTKAPVQLAGASVNPGEIPALGAGGHTLPTSLVVFLALLGGGMLVGAATIIGRRVLARRRA